MLSIRKLIIFHEVSFVLTALSIDVSHGVVELLLRFDVAFSQKKDLRFINCVRVDFLNNGITELNNIF